jgi:hypothetical protein
MRLLEKCSISSGGRTRELRLYVGDLAAIPQAEAVDLLVLSAFPNDYVPTRTSLIGALARAGISVALLAKHKAVDLRDAFSCWLSEDVSYNAPNAGFKRLLCFEPQHHSMSGEPVRDMFRAIMPFAFDDGPPMQSIAMPILASGDQGLDAAAMMEAQFRAAIYWLEHGMPVDSIKIVVYSDAIAEKLRPRFVALTAQAASAPPTDSTPAQYDCFISYSHQDATEADRLVDALRLVRPDLRIFRDRERLSAGVDWQSKLDDGLANCERVIVIYSPAYLKSPNCLEEFNMARIRHRESSQPVLAPIYLRSAILPLYMRTLHYIDCREADLSRLTATGGEELAALFS